MGGALYVEPATLSFGYDVPVAGNRRGANARAICSKTRIARQPVRAINWVHSEVGDPETTPPA